jgi:Tol biopolymer transport system component
MAKRSNKPAQICLVDPDGKNMRIVTNGSMPRWSPDGRRLIFVRGSKDNRASIWVANTDGSGAQEIVDDSSMSGFPRWSPDGTRIIFSSDREGHSAIYSANPDGSKVQRLIYSKDLDFFSPILSPDESHLVVFAGHIFDGRGRTMMRVDAPISILVIALDTTHQTDVLDQGVAPSVFWTSN